MVAKPKIAPEARGNKTINRLIGWGAWLANFKKAHPDATKKEIAAAWQEVRGDQIRAGGRAVKALEKQGFRIVSD